MIPWIFSKMPLVPLAKHSVIFSNSTLLSMIFFFSSVPQRKILSRWKKRKKKHLPPTPSVPTLWQLLKANRIAMLQYADPITGSTLAINFQLKITIMPITCINNHIISIFCHQTIIVITPQFMECFARGMCTQSHSHFPLLSFKLPISFCARSLQMKIQHT